MLCSLFDAEKKTLFHEGDILRGGYVAKTRGGERAFVPLVTLSCAVVDMQKTDNFHISEVVADLKSEVKRKTAKEGRSLWLRQEDTEDIEREDLLS